MSKTQLYYTQYRSGTYAVTDGKVRCCAIDGAWIDATPTAEELDERVRTGRVIGPFNVNNFKEKHPCI